MAIATEIQRPAIRLSHFSIVHGVSFLREGLRQRVNVVQPEQTAEEARMAREASHLRVADRVIQTVISTAFPQARNRADLLNEAKLLPPDPEKALATVESNGETDTRLTFERVRKMLLAGIAAQLDQRSVSHRLLAELHDVHTLLDQNLFSGNVGETNTTTTYSVHDRSTNQVSSIHDTYPLFVKPGKRVKKFVQESRYVEGVGFVMSSVREKSAESAVLKALRKAVQGRDNEGTDHIDAVGAVKDAMGLMFVVKGAMGSDDEKVEKLRDKVLGLLQAKYGQIEVRSDNSNGNKENNGLKTHAEYQRVLVTVATLPLPLELIFYGEGAYINDSYNIGRKIRESKGSYTGNAHSLYEIERVRKILPVIYPETVDGQPIKGYEGLVDEVYQTMDTQAAALRRDKVVPLGRRLRERYTSRKHIPANKQI